MDQVSEINIIIIIIVNCIRHKRDISMCYSQLIDICSSASDSIPTTSSPSHHSKAGWNDNIKYLRDDAL